MQKVFIEGGLHAEASGTARQTPKTPIFIPLDVEAPGHMEAVFERIEKEWGKLDFVVHSIAFHRRRPSAAA